MNASKHKARAQELKWQAARLRDTERKLKAEAVHIGLAAKALEEQAAEMEQEL